MIIEFVGPSGAGKTFISQRLKDYLQANMSKPKKIIFGNKKEIDTCFNSTVERILFNLLFILKLLTDRNFLSLLFLRINAKGKKFSV